MTNWIVSDPEVLGGKPRIRGTRIGVDLVLDLVADGATVADLLSAYPHLTPESIEAALRYAASSVRNEQVWILKRSA
ncbi:MAG: DUF433 domain-containing protein [Myxococcales bacterium]|nr:DUF433 domain-containing protein [Myxococcales bacterium]